MCAHDDHVSRIRLLAVDERRELAEAASPRPSTSNRARVLRLGGLTGPNGLPPVDDAARAAFRPDLRNTDHRVVATSRCGCELHRSTCMPSSTTRPGGKPK
jgi:hypothetical protein